MKSKKVAINRLRKRMACDNHAHKMQQLQASAHVVSNNKCVRMQVLDPTRTRITSTN